MNLWIGHNKDSGVTIAQPSLLKVKEKIQAHSTSPVGEWHIIRADIGKPSQDKLCAILSGEDYVENIAEEKRYNVTVDSDETAVFTAIRGKKSEESAAEDSYVLAAAATMGVFYVTPKGTTVQATGKASTKTEGAFLFKKPDNTLIALAGNVVLMVEGEE